MKRTRLLLITVLTFLVTALPAQTIRLMTYNIRYDNPADGENNWHNRKEGLVRQLKFHEPGIFGIQEGLAHQVAYLDSSLSSYRYVGVGRDDGKGKGEFSAVFYDTGLFKLVDQTTFWLSETPEKVSVGWDAALERICTCALFEQTSSGRKMWVFNTHFDHIGEKAREHSAALILERMSAMNKEGYPAVLMGDFNLEPGTTAIQSIAKKMNDTRYAATRVSFGPDATFNDFRFDVPPSRRIDYIFTSPGSVRVLKYAVLTDSQDGRYYSDHLPVFAVIELTGH